jgi:YVTN family beta-propeller protein
MIKLHWQRSNWRRAQRVVRRAATMAASGFVAVALTTGVRAQMKYPAPQTLPTGRIITPLGTQVNIGSLPTNIILTPDGNFAIVSDGGFRELLSVLGTAGANAGKLADGGTSPLIQGTPDGTMNFNGGLNNTPPNPFPTSLGQLPTTQTTYDPYPTSSSQLRFGDAYSYNAGLYYGTAVKSSPNNTYTLFASRGDDNRIFIAGIDATGKLKQPSKTAGQPINGTTPGAVFPFNTSTAAGNTSGPYYTALNKASVYLPGYYDFPAGMALDNNGLLYIAINEWYNYSDNSITNTATPGALQIYNTNTGTFGKRFTFNVLPQDIFGTYIIPNRNSRLPGKSAPFTPTNYPFAVAPLGDGSKVYVTSERDGGVYVINTNSGAQSFISTSAIPTTKPNSAAPISLLLNGTTLYVANAGNDSVSVINTATDTVTNTINLRPALASDLPGVTPTGLALSNDGSTLYVTLADMNALGIVNLSTSQVNYAPLGWYPTGVAVLKDGSVLVTNGKGVTAIRPGANTVTGDLVGIPNTYHLTNDPDTNPNVVATNPSKLAFDDTFYDLDIVEGTVGHLTPADLANVAANTNQVIANNGLSNITHGNIPAENPLSDIGLQAGGITHVFYIVKENRTYDQVLGDLNTAAFGNKGNGDPSLTLYGNNVTPNLHNMALNYVLLDNFYDCSEVSGDGWPWSTQAQASQDVIREIPYNYGRDRSYDTEGYNQNYPVGGFPAKSPDGNTNSAYFPNGGPAIPDVAEAPGGHIWDAARKAGLTYRNYGFYVADGLGIGPTAISPPNYPGSAGLQPGGHYNGGALNPAANGYTDLDFKGFNTSYADSDGPSANGPTTYPISIFGKYNAPNRFAEWNREFQGMLAAGTVPNFETIKFMTDHTNGYKKGAPTPPAMVADNDYAIGEFVQTISHSSIWSHTAIFIIEDDAQDGADHVDCHRSTCYVISPYILNNTTDSNFYNTVSVLKAIEDLLGLPPMNQYDAAATPVALPEWDTAPNNSAAYTLNTSAAASGLIRQTASLKIGPKDPRYKLVKMSEKLDFSHADMADPRILNQILWMASKGVNSKMPAPRHNVVLTPKKATNVAKKTVARDADD